MVGYGFDRDRIRSILRRDLKACRDSHVDITLKDVETVQSRSQPGPKLGQSHARGHRRGLGVTRVFRGGQMDYTQPTKEYVFGDERPFASCHASTLVLLPDGSVLAAWFGGSKEGADDVAIWCARREGGRWSTPLRVSELEGVPHWNPVLFQADGGPIHLYYKVGRTIPAWQTWVRTSKDGSHTWSASRPLVEGDRGGRGPVKNKPIRLLDGTWLAPASIEGKKWDAFVDISHDRGQSWTQSEIVPLRRSGLGTKPQPTPSAPPVPDLSFQGKGVIQPTLWESEPNNVHMLLRSSQGRILRSDSVNGGQTWCTAYPTLLPNNNSGIDLTKLPGGALALAYNPVGENWGARTPLVLAISEDNGNTWGSEKVLEDQEGEYSYPAIVSRGNEIALTYTWRRERIAFWHMSLS